MRPIVMFHSPSRTQRHSTFNWTAHAPEDYANTQATWRLNDPGEYLIYIYSEFMICRAWKDMDYPWFKASAEGTPVRLIVQPALMPFFEEGFVICSENDTTHGRYLATTYVQLAHSLESVRMGSL